MRLFLILLLCTSLSAMETHVFPITGYRVIDGDSIEIMADLGFDLYKKTSVRLYGINVPEVRGKGKEFGLLVKSYVEEYVKDKTILFKWIKRDMYGGRSVGYIYVDGVNLSTHLLESGLAKPYYGKGPKPTFTLEEIQESLNELRENEKSTSGAMDVGRD